jgi:hypothetical protein
MATSTNVRTQLIAGDFIPIPVNGKAAVLEGWQKRTETSQGDLDIWARTYPDAKNTGMLCTHTPTLDIDILDEAASDAAVALVRERFGDLGKILLRYGQRPKCAVPFRLADTAVPFDKITIPLTAPDGTGQKLEFLARGQQCVVHGIHPDTGSPYQWSGGHPGKVKRAELPLIDAAGAKALIEAVADLLVRDHGYQRATSAASAPRDGQAGGGNGADGNGPDAWGQLTTDILAGRNLHDSLCSLSAKLIASGMTAGAAVNHLRGLMDHSQAQHDKRWKARYREIPKLVDSAARLAREKAKQEQDAPIPEVDGARVLADALTYQKRFVCYPSGHAAVAHTLWNAHAHMMDAWESTPRLAFLSAEPTSGKTRSLEISEPMVPNAVSTVNASAPYLFRRAGSDKGPPTVFFDEIDTIFGPKAKEHEDIRGFINSGHRRGATYGRCVVHGSTVMTEDTPVYAAVALAGLGWLPDTLLARSIIIRMRRRLRTERVEPYRRRDHAPQAKEIGRRLAGWASTVVEAAKGMRPVMPPGVEDRAADCWEPLLVVSDLAGGEWPKLAREAAVALVAASQNQTPVSLYLRLLGDTRTVFWKNLTAVAQSQPKGLPTKRLLEDLYTLDDAPWNTINKGEAYSPTQLATCLFEYGVTSDYLRPHPSQPHLKARGYKLRDLADAWRRYLSPLSLPRNSVAGVAGVARETLDQFFEWLEEPEEITEDGFATSATPATPSSGGERGLAEALDPSRIEQLADWYRQKAKALRAEMSPATLTAHLATQLRATLAEELVPGAIDAAIRQIGQAVRKGGAKAGAKPAGGGAKPATSRKGRAKP